MAKNKQDIVERKRAAWKSRTALALGISEDSVEPLLLIPRKQAFRVNPLLASDSVVVSSLQAQGWQGDPISWCPHCYEIDTGIDILKASEEAATGKIYIQNPASWLPVLALDPKPGEHILDMCAAPGGKTAHMAAISNNQAVITANDNSRVRLARMRANLDRLGATNVNYTLFDAANMSRKFEGQVFDKILLDAPCSGEGMMTLASDKDFASWSVAHIKRLQQLQKKMIVQAWRLLKPGGTLVYSTCTMAPEENEAVVDYLLRKNNDALVRTIPHALTNVVPAVRGWNGKTFDVGLQFALRLIPSTDAEAFFVAKIQKLDETIKV